MSQLQVTGEAKIRDIQGPVVANSGVITALDGAASQYVRGDGTLADFPTSSGGGSSVSYYLNSSVSQGTIGGVAYRELSKEPIIGAGTDIAISSNGYVASYLTDANDPDVILIPGGNFNCEFYFSVNNNTGNPFFYAELYKYDGTTFTLLGSSVGVPEYITQGTTIAPYYFAIPVATAALALTDRLAIRIYVNVDGRTVTLHTENGHLCQVVTTLSKGMVSLNNLTDQSQFLAVGTSGTDFNIVSSGDTHTFNIPSASATNRGLITTGTQTIAGAKTFSNNIISDGSILLKNGIQSILSGYVNIGGNAFGKGIDITFPDSGGSPLTNTLNFNPTTAYSYIFPAASGTLALTSNLSSYVPYTGATADVNLGVNFLIANAAKFDGSGSFGGHIALKQNGTAAAYTGYATLSSIGVNKLNIYYGEAAAYATELDNSLLTQSRLYKFPDLSGTLALLEGTQTFTGTKTFSLDIAVNGLTVGRGAGSVSTNTVLGLASFATNTTGTYNVAIGQSALNSNTTGGYNTAVGGSAMVANSTGSFNTAIGFGTLNYNSTGTNNTALGYSSLYTNTTGSQNTALGAASLYHNTTGVNNTAIGNVALQQNTTGVNNTAIGSFSSYVNTTGQNNTSVGASTLIANTTGSQNTAIGSASLQANTTGESNVGVGVSSLGVNTIGQYNVALGRSASNANTTGNYNTALGSQALANVTTGSQNIAIGYNSGGGITTGSQNTIIGIVTGLSSTLSNNIILADGAGNIRYQWNGTNNVFGNPISGTTGSFASSGGSDTFAINHSSGSGIALNITKGGNGEGLYINKTSGSGNAATIIGTLNATTLVKSGGTSSQYLMADGSTSTLTNPVTGTGTTNYLPKFTGASTIGNSSISDNGTGRVSIGTTSFNDSFVISNSGAAGWEFSNLGSVITYNRSTSAYIPMTFQASSFGFTGAATFSSDINLGGSITSTVSGTSELRLRGGGYGGSYNTSLRSIAGGIGVLQFGNNNDNYILAGNTGTGGFLSIRVNVTTESITSGIEAMRITLGGNVLVGTTTDAGQKLQVSGMTNSGISYRAGTYTQGDTTPSVSGVSYLGISNSSPTTITNFTNGIQYQIITLYFSDSNTTINRSNCYLSGGVNFTSTAADILTLINIGGLWYEVSRSVNS